MKKYGNSNSTVISGIKLAFDDTHWANVTEVQQDTRQSLVVLDGSMEQGVQ